jgi:hypothetical protein
MAKQLSAFLISNGAADTRAQPKQAKDAKLDGKPVRPESDGLSPQGEPGRNAKRLARPGEPPEGVKPAAEGQPPEQAAIERGPDGRKLPAKQKLTKRGKGGVEEPPKTDLDNPDVVKEEPSKGEPPKDVSNLESGKEDGAKPAGEDKSAPAKVDAAREPGSGETPALRPDPVPPVTPAPPASATAPAASQAPATAVSSATPEPAAAPSTPTQPSTPAQAAPAAVTASVPPPPVTPAGPPAPPISQ